MLIQKSTFTVWGHKIFQWILRKKERKKENISATNRPIYWSALCEKVSSSICVQWRAKSACTSVQRNQDSRCPSTESLHTIKCINGKQMRRWDFPVSIHYKSIAGRYRPVRVADGPITARYRFIKNASWVCACVRWIWIYAFCTCSMTFLLVAAHLIVQEIFTYLKLPTAIACIGLQRAALKMNYMHFKFDNADHLSALPWGNVISEHMYMYRSVCVFILPVSLSAFHTCLQNQ